MHALVVEDEPIVAAELAAALEAMGFPTVDIAANGKEAIAAAARRSPDLIVADMHLADGELGPDVVLRITRAGLAAVVYVTSSPESLASNPNVIVVAKPFDAARLRAAVERAVAAAKFLRSPTTRRF